MLQLWTGLGRGQMLVLLGSSESKDLPWFMDLIASSWLFTSHEKVLTWSMEYPTEHATVLTFCNTFCNNSYVVLYCLHGVALPAGKWCQMLWIPQRNSNHLLNAFRNVSFIRMIFQTQFDFSPASCSRLYIRLESVPSLFPPLFVLETYANIWNRLYAREFFWQCLVENEFPWQMMQHIAYSSISC